MRYICLSFLVMWFFLPVVTSEIPVSKTRGLREFRSWVRLVLTGSSDKGGG